jgi:hypothetical protein
MNETDERNRLMGLRGPVSKNHCLAAYSKPGAAGSPRAAMALVAEAAWRKYSLRIAANHPGGLARAHGLIKAVPALIRCSFFQADRG